MKDVYVCLSYEDKWTFNRLLHNITISCRSGRFNCITPILVEATRLAAATWDVSLAYLEFYLVLQIYFLFVFEQLNINC